VIDRRDMGDQHTPYASAAIFFESPRGTVGLADGAGIELKPPILFGALAAKIAGDVIEPMG
jgi:hypothetical protein